MTGYEWIQKLVAEAAGFDFQTLGEASFKRTVDSAMVRRGFASCNEYAAALRHNDAELQNLIEDLVVPETWFFRDRGPFEFLGGWARSASVPFLRVLSAPCATGEEAYSIAITLLEAGLAPDRFSIDAVDISRRALETALRAVYSRSSFREPWRAYRDYFISVENGFALPREITALVHFHCDNIVHPDFLRDQKPYHAVFCRNLLIYMGSESRKAALATLGRLLAPNGIVVVGAPELPGFVQSGYTALPYPHSFACCKASPVVVHRQPPACPATIRDVSPPAVEAATTPLAEAPLDMAWRLADEGALEQASELCDQLLAEGSARPDHYYLKGLLSEASNRLDAAEEFFRKALYLDPDHYPALLHMSALCEQRGERSRGDLFRTRARRVAERGGELHEPRR